jgi:hypothetical protein
MISGKLSEKKVFKMPFWRDKFINDVKDMKKLIDETDIVEVVFKVETRDLIETISKDLQEMYYRA